MKAWLARKMQEVVTRLTAPVTARILDRFEAAARDTRELHGITSAKLEALSDVLAQQGDSTRREIVETAGRDLGVVVRMLAAADSRAASLHPGANHVAPQASRAVPAPAPRLRYVTFLGAQPGPDDAKASALLRALRYGLDRLDDVTEGQPEIWLEHSRATAEPEGGLTSETYVRALKGGTRFIEIMRPADALAIRQALDRNRRTDVPVIFRCLGTGWPEAGQDGLRQALACTDHWIFPSQGVCDAVRAIYGSSIETRAPGHTYIHPMPDAAATDPIGLARSYRASAMDVVTTHGADLRSA